MEDRVHLTATLEDIAQLQQRLSALTLERDTALDQVHRLQKRLSGSKDAWQQRIHSLQTHISSQETRLKQVLETENNHDKREIDRLTRLLVLERTGQRMENAKKACELERLRTAKGMNTELKRSNKGLYRELSECERSGNIEEMYASAVKRVNILEKQQNMLVTRLSGQEEVLESQVRQLRELGGLVQDVKELYHYSLQSSPRSGLRSLQSGTQSPKGSRAISAKKLRREIRRYQEERNALEISSNPVSQRAVKALRRLIQRKSKALRCLSLEKV